MIRKEINIITGEEKIIQLTEQEINELNIKKTQAEADKQARETKKAEDLANKQSALNKLKALGLNDAEINSILGK
jgi:hypothetical protein